MLLFELSGGLISIQGEFGPTVHIKEKLHILELNKDFKKNSLKVFIRGGEGEKSMLPNRVIRDNELIGSPGWDV